MRRGGPLTMARWRLGLILATVAFALWLAGSAFPTRSDAFSAQAGATSGFAGDTFNGVSCPSSVVCTVVGASGAADPQPVAAQWNGTSWVEESVPAPAGAQDASLQAVSCPSSMSCLAVGVSFTSGQALPQAFAEDWNGTGWSLQSVPAPTGAAGTKLLSVSCRGSVRCTAAGYSQTSGGADRVLADGWNGARWSVEPWGGGAPPGKLEAVSCPSRRWCMAVGVIGKRGVAIWNGTHWAVQQARSAPFGADQVSCPAPGSCTVLNSDNSGIHAHHWNGKRWSVRSFGRSLYNPEVDALSCPTRTSCMALGIYQDSSDTSGTWTERRTAKGWSSAGYAPDGATDIPSAVSCPSPSACLAVGGWSFLGTVYSSGPMAWSWNGKAWSNVSPAPFSG